MSYKLTRKTNVHSLELSLKNRSSFFTLDLLKGIIVAFALHLLLFILFRVDNPIQEEKFLILRPVSVEIDRQSLVAKPIFSPTATDLSFSCEKPLIFPSYELRLSLENKQFPHLTNREVDFSDLEKIPYAPVIETLSLPLSYFPLRLSFTSVDKLELSPKTLKLVEKSLEKKRVTSVCRLLYNCIIELSSGKIKHCELLEMWGKNPDAIVASRGLLEKIKFKKGKDKEVKADVELWLELEEVR